MNKSIMKIVLASLLAFMLIVQVANALTASPNKTEFYPGDTLVVSGTATANALVAVTVENPTGALVTLAQGKAAGDGSFSIDVLTFPSSPTSLLPFGTYTVTVKDTATGEETSFTVEFTSPVATINGVVVDEQGAPIEGATVTVKLAGTTVGITYTDANGQFSVDVVDPGTYTVEVSKDGYVTQTTTVDIPSIPAVETITVTLSAQTLSISVESITRDGKPFAGVAREGETLTVKLKVLYGNDEVTDATVKGYLTSAPRAMMGLPPIEFDLVYDSGEQAYVGTVELPAPGLDRECTLTFEATWNDMSAEESIKFITLVNNPQSLQDLETRVGNLENQTNSLSQTIQDLKDNVNTLSSSLSDLQAQLNSLSSTVQSLQDQIANLASKSDLDQLRSDLNSARSDITTLQSNLNSLQSQLNDLQGQLNSLSSQMNNLQSQLDDLQSQVQGLSGAKGLAQAAVALGIIAIIIAIAVMLFLNRKISA